MYTDDTSMENKILNLIEKRINQNLINLCRWLRANPVSLNIVLNSEYIIIGLAQKINNLTTEPPLL